jgi:hypothetical protein
VIRYDDNDDGVRIAGKAGTHYNPAVDVVIASVSADGELMGGVVYQGYTGASVQMHVASFMPNWITKDLLWVTFHYPFEQLGVKKVFGQVGVHNTKALEFDLKLGFKEETRIADVYPEGDMALLSMYKADCRWLAIKPLAVKDTSDGR